MQTETISFQSPILYGHISVVKNKCGRPNCACKKDPSKLHGPYHVWTGIIDGKQTSRTISEDLAEECRRKIDNYRKLQERIKALIDEELQNLQWSKRDKGEGAK